MGIKALERAILVLGTAQRWAQSSQRHRSRSVAYLGSEGLQPKGIAYLGPLEGDVVMIRCGAEHLCNKWTRFFLNESESTIIKPMSPWSLESSERILVWFVC